MLPFAIAVIAIALYFFFRRALFIVPQSQAVVVERLGKFSRVAYSGLNILIPGLESQRRIHYRVKQYDRQDHEIGTQLMATPWIDMREKVLDFSSQSVITKDNVVMSIDAVLYYRITDPVKVVYEVANFAEAIEKLTQTTLRNVVGELTLDETLASREIINARLRATLDEVAERWGVQVTRVELEDISLLARLGDPRPGVGVDPEMGLPDIAWCEVPTGPFIMGTREEEIPALLEQFGGERRWYETEVPQHKVTLPAYRIGKYPVTNAQYAAFVAAGGYGERRYWTETGWQWKEDRTGPEKYGGVFDLPNHPVVRVTWYEAAAYCRWLTERLRQAGKVGVDEEVTLPTEAEWEKAARGTDGRIFPWGDDADPNRANYSDTGIGTTSAVGCFPGGVSPYGVEDLSGNVWEWCRTKWQGSYEDYRDDNALEGSGLRVLRGGSFYDLRRLARCAFRRGSYPDFGWDDSGFRVVVSPISPSSALWHSAL